VQSMDAPMPAGEPAPEAEPPAPDLDAAADAELAADPRALQILTTEHWSLLSARGLAYNESFTRASMYLAFISMSFVGLALLAPAEGFDTGFLSIAALVLGFDFVIGILTGMRMVFAGLEDSRATRGMNRIRNGYLRIAPSVERFLVTAATDDVEGLVRSQSLGGSREAGGFAYSISTSAAMIGLITTLIGGTLATTIALLFEVAAAIAVPIGVVVAVVFIGASAWVSISYVFREMNRYETLFPKPPGN